MTDGPTQRFDGIYMAYFTGVAGSSFAMFVFVNGVVSGADAGGGKYDGTFAIDGVGRMRGFGLLFRPDTNR